MRVDTSQSPIYLQFVEQRLGITFEGIRAKWIAFLGSDDTLLGVAVYSHFTPHCCNLTIVSTSPRGCSKQALAAIFGYPFIQLGLRRISTVVAESNIRSIENTRRLGFTCEGIFRFYFGDEHGVAWGMLREECKWI